MSSSKIIEKHFTVMPNYYEISEAALKPGSI